MQVTRLEGISQLAILDSITLYGSTRNALVADPEYIRQVMASVEYPVPDDIEVIILPFILERIDEQKYVRNGVVDGVAVYSARKVYVSAFHLFDWNSEAYRLQAWAKTCLHEIGHMIHGQYLPAPRDGQPDGLWVAFTQVTYALANNSYETSLAEHFAEWWRFLFSPMTQGVPHRHGLPYKTGIKEWMLSLAGALGLAIDHNKAYVRGDIIPLKGAPIIHNGMAYVPLRFTSEVDGKRVQWSNPHTIAIWPKIGGA